jgi:protein tyrosine/serine phosphatase
MAAVFFVAPATIAQESDGSVTPDITNIKIRNFGQMDDRFYRGGQPEKEDYASLAALGVDTVIDLRNDAEEWSKTEAEAAGMKYVNISMSGWKYPKDSDVTRFMEVMNEPSTGTVYVHCKAGKHRTGLAGAVYRLNEYGWEYDEAYKEMKKYDYSSWPVHFNIKAYVKNYYKRGRVMQPVTAKAAIGAAAAPSGN